MRTQNKETKQKDISPMIDKTKEFETKPIAALLWQYALPAVITQIIASIYNICDRVFLGQCVGALAIAGLTVTMPIMNIIHAFGSLVGAGAGARMSPFCGSVGLGKKKSPVGTGLKYGANDRV